MECTLYHFWNLRIHRLLSFSKFLLLCIKAFFSLQAKNLILGKKSVGETKELGKMMASLQNNPHVQVSAMHFSDWFQGPHYYIGTARRTFLRPWEVLSESGK